MSKDSLNIDGKEVKLITREKEDYISLTDIANSIETDSRNSEYFILNWLRLGSTLEFLGAWEKVHNYQFDVEGFDEIRKSLTSNSFRLSVKRWIASTKAIGIEAKSGRYGGTYAHRDIAIQFCYWLSPTFQIYLIKEFQRLQNERRESLEWDVRRILSKVNYHIHSDAVRENRVPLIDWNTKREAIYQASEADLLNIVVFGQTARMWKQANPKKKGNQRDHATPEQLVVLANMEAINAELMREGLDKRDRFQRMVAAAQYQLSILNNLKFFPKSSDERSKKLDT